MSFLRPTLFPALALGLFGLAAPASAALSGFYDSGEQIQTILSNGDVANAVGQRPIKGLDFEGTRRDGALEWEVDTEGCDLTVFLIPQAPGMPGKTTYTLETNGRCD